MLKFDAARPVIHLQFDINAKAIEIRAVQSPKCMADVLITEIWIIVVLQQSSNLNIHILLF
jgi:hypothetical protein